MLQETYTQKMMAIYSRETGVASNEINVHDFEEWLFWNEEDFQNEI